MGSEGSIGKMDYTDREILVRIATQTEAILERLNKGDTMMGDHDRHLIQHDNQITALHNRVCDLDGGDGWPSFVDLQKAHLRHKTLSAAAVALWTGFLACAMALAAWLGFWHPRP
jgi:hypothetical protein